MTTIKAKWVGKGQKKTRYAWKQEGDKVTVSFVVKPKNKKTR